MERTEQENRDQRQRRGIKLSKDPHAQAKVYVKEALESQRRHGQPARVSKDDFDAAVERVAAGFAQLAAARR